MLQTSEGKHIDGLVGEILHGIDRFEAITGVRYATRLGHGIHMQPNYDGKVIPMDLFNAAKTGVIIDNMSNQHFSDVYRAVKGSSNEAINKVMSLMAEYELIHYLRVHLQRSAQIGQEDYFSADSFYHDNPPIALKNMPDEEKKGKEGAIGKILSLYALEVAYINTLAAVTHYDPELKDAIIKNAGTGGDGYYQVMAERREELLRDPPRLDLFLLEHIVRDFLSSERG